jgi:hypothetical protein
VSDLDGDSPAVRREMAELWAFRALAEASAGRRLLRVAGRLERIDADPALIALARRAAGDELRHQRLCEETARLFGEVEVPPLVPTEVTGPADDRRDRAIYEVVAACCVSETLNVRVMAASLVGTRHEGLRRVQKEILRDEVDHSALGWRFVEQEARRQELAFLGPMIPGMLGLRSRSRLFRPAEALPDEERLRALGWLPRAALLALYQETLETQIFPRLERLDIPCDEARRALAEARRAPGG